MFTFDNDNDKMVLPGQSLRLSMIMMVRMKKMPFEIWVILYAVFFKTLASFKNVKYPIILETLIYVSILFSS